MRRLLARAALAVAAVLGVSACGEAETPAEAAPAVAESLAAVDDAIARGDHAAAREALDELVAGATRAGETGQLDDEQVDAILDAAARLEDELPAPEEPSEEPVEEESSPAPTPTEDEEDEDDEDDHPGKGKAKGKDKKDEDD